MTGPLSETWHSREGSGRIRVVVAEDTFLVREALEAILATSDRVELVGSCGDRDSLVTVVEETRPDAVVTDIRMPPTGTDEGVQISRWMRTAHPEIGVVVLSQFTDPSYVLGVLESGSERRAYLLKERISDPEQLIAAIDAVVAGESLIDPRVVEVLVQSRIIATKSPLSDLTPREHEVLSELAQGKSNAAIAQSLVLTRRAVEKHINSIFVKLNLPSPEDVSRRVTAALMFLADHDGSSSSG